MTNEFSKAEVAARKKAVFDTMSPRRQKRIKKIGFDRWDPFMAPKDPIDIRKDKTNRTAHQLVREYIAGKMQKGASDAYRRGVLEMAVGIVNGDLRLIGMYEFAVWHNQFVKKVKSRHEQK